MMRCPYCHDTTLGKAGDRWQGCITPQGVRMYAYHRCTNPRCGCTVVDLRDHRWPRVEKGAAR